MDMKLLLLSLLLLSFSVQAEKAEDSFKTLRPENAVLKESNLKFAEILPCSENNKELGWCLNKVVEKGKSITALKENTPCTALVGESTEVETAVATFQGSKLDNMNCSSEGLEGTLALIDTRLLKYTKASSEQSRLVKTIASSYTGEKNGVCSNMQGAFVLNGVPVVEILSCNCETDACGSKFYEITQSK